MDINNANGYSLNNLGKINIILGKNGFGKSTLLKAIEGFLKSSNLYGTVKYISPERGGSLIYEPGIDQTLATQPSYIADSRRRNQVTNFRQQSISQFKQLETLFLRELDQSMELRRDENYTFSRYFGKLNELLDNISIHPLESRFRILNKETNQEIPPESISSGEAELITLGIECLMFQKECDPTKINFLLFDAPDVHLHPDLEARLAKLLVEIINDKNAIVILTTHSTSFLGALEDYEDTCIEFMSNKQKEINFKKIKDEHRKILPIFGAHPLSNVFNKKPILLVEGEDEERIWQQAVRSSLGKLKIYPCSVDGLGNMNRYEKEVDQLMSCIYDNAKAFSLRDRDDKNEEIDNFKAIKRMRLACRSSENLLLTTEVLNFFEITWDEVKQKIDTWLDNNSGHSHHNYVKKFKDEGYDRKNFNLKNIRNDLLHIIGQSISWETAIGKTIGKLLLDGQINTTDPDGIFTYLGTKFVDHVI